MMQVLIIAYVWPEPDSSAAGSRMMQLISFFQRQDWQVNLASPAADSTHMPDIESLGVRKVSIDLNNTSFDRFIEGLAPDLVMFDRFMMEEQFGWRVEQQCPQALRIIDTEDLHCLRDARHRALKAGRQMTTSDLFSDLAKREVAAILRCDLALMISDVEIGVLTERFGVAPALLHHTPFLLDPVDADTAAWPSFAQRQHFISIGNFRHAPNWDAVLQLRKDIWPRIRGRLPDAQLHVYGAYAPPKASQLHQPRQGFHVLGWAQDATMVMRQARICLAPLRFGAGIKGKLIDAMRCGTPSVTTAIGVEAMHGDLPWGGAVEDQAEAFAEAAVELYQDQSAWRDAQARGLQILNEGYNRSHHEQALLSRLEQIRTSLSEHRLNNFTGAMLRHHSMKSTQYMAQWIEAKNKVNGNSPKKGPKKESVRFSNPDGDLGSE